MIEDMDACSIASVPTYFSSKEIGEKESRNMIMSRCSCPLNHKLLLQRDITWSTYKCISNSAVGLTSTPQAKLKS